MLGTEIGHEYGLAASVSSELPSMAVDCRSSGTAQLLLSVPNSLSGHLFSFQTQSHDGLN